jgi:hypothetical protein
MLKGGLVNSKWEWKWILIPLFPFFMRVPDYADRAQAVRRAQARRRGSLRKFRFFASIGYEWSVWDEELCAVESEWLPLSEDLKSALLAWYRTFMNGLDDDFEWADEEVHKAWLLEGEKLAEWIRYETWPVAGLKVQFRDQ